MGCHGLEERRNAATRAGLAELLVDGSFVRRDARPHSSSSGLVLPAWSVAPDAAAVEDDGKARTLRSGSRRGEGRRVTALLRMT